MKKTTRHMSEAQRIGARIRAARQNAGWAQTDLALAAGLRSPIDVSRYERGHAVPRLQFLVAIAQALGLTVTELIDR